jgi:hypothetical protein
VCHDRAPVMPSSSANTTWTPPANMPMPWPYCCVAWLNQRRGGRCLRLRGVDDAGDDGDMVGIRESGGLGRRSRTRA